MLSVKFFKNIAVISTSVLVLTACQSTKTTSQTTTTTVLTQPKQAEATVATVATLPKDFNINGKIGLTTPQQTGSAFYVWSQKGNNFGIELSGALNAGQTNINYNGKTATLTSAKGEMTADNPEELLLKATGWQAPISQLPYWIMGDTAPSDSQIAKDDNNRLTTAVNGDWTATFTYKDGTLPQRINIAHPDGYKVVLTINHLQ